MTSPRAAAPLLLVALLFPAAPVQAEPRVRLRADVRAAWALTDGVGVSDHGSLGFEVGPQFGPDAGTVFQGIAPLLSVAGGIAEGGSASLRLLGGAEAAFALRPGIEIVPSLLLGYLRCFGDDRRHGLGMRGGLALRVAGERDFYLMFEPLTVLVLPPPPGGVTRNGSHVAWDLGLVRFGGRTL